MLIKKKIIRLTNTVMYGSRTKTVIKRQYFDGARRLTNGCVNKNKWFLFINMQNCTYFKFTIAGNSISKVTFFADASVGPIGVRANGSVRIAGVGKALVNI